MSKALDKGKIVVGVFLHLKKAFDTVNHTILLRKLELYGIRGNVHDWLSSYLNNRSQFVHYNEYNSSILGPLLFIIYINDFSRASRLLFSILFAEDTSVFIEGTNYDKIIDILNTEMKRIDIWLKSNKLSIKILKTHYMMFHRTRIKCEKRTITIRDNSLTYSKNTKLFGVIIDDKLNWSDHILYIKNTILKSIGIIHKTHNYLYRNTLRSIYFTFIYPYLIYCIESWGNSNDSHLNPIIKIQKKGIRAISFAHYLDPTSPLFRRLNILN